MQTCLNDWSEASEVNVQNLVSGLQSAKRMTATVPQVGHQQMQSVKGPQRVVIKLQIVRSAMTMKQVKRKRKKARSPSWPTNKNRMPAIGHHPQSIQLRTRTLARTEQRGKRLAAMIVRMR